MYKPCYHKVGITHVQYMGILIIYMYIILRKQCCC